MCPTQKKKLNYTAIEKYRLPIYARQSKDKFVYFYVLDPLSVLEGAPRMKRLKKKFAHIHGARERDEAALRFRDEVSAKLKRGWNPLIEESGAKQFTLFTDAAERYSANLKKLVRDDALRTKTFTDYCSKLDMLRTFNNRCPTPIYYIYQFDMAYVESFLDWIYIDRNNGPCTRNNYLTWLSTFCTWLRNHGYIVNNPCTGIRKLREPDKQRKPLPSADVKRLGEYLQGNKPFLLACMMQYYTLVRPRELVQLRIGDINVKQQTVFVSHTISKNRKDGVVTLPKKVILLMLELGTLTYPSHYYLFGKGFMPGTDRQSDRIFRDEFVNIRKALDFPPTYKFYSLKDSGITETIIKAGLVVAKDQARHSSIQITNAYCAKEQMSAHPELLNYEGDL